MILKTFKTSTFRLAAIYLTVFAISTGAILGYIYWNTVVILEQQVDDTVKAEVQGLAEQYRQRGLPGLVEIIRERSRQNTGSVYLLSNFIGRRLAGNLQGLPAKALRQQGWIEFSYEVQMPDGTAHHIARAVHSELDGGYMLLVGRDIEERRLFAQLIRTALFWSLGLALVFGVGGAMLLSRNFLRRIDSIAATSRTIMAGDLTGRMPVSGTGDELDRLASSLNEMLDQIERLMTGMKEVSGNVAHDLRTPLNRMRSNLEAAIRGETRHKSRKVLESVLADADQLLATFNALLSIARAEAGEARAGFSDVDATALCSELVELYEPIFEEQGGVLRLTAPPGVTLRADRQLLAQAITNLLDNALKYGHTGKTGKLEVELQISATDTDTQIIVADRGPGIKPADRGRVTKRFVRLEQSRTEPGNGLGLSLVKGVMKLHGGRLLLVDNSPGLRVILSFPQIQEQAAARGRKK